MRGIPRPAALFLLLAYASGCGSSGDILPPTPVDADAQEFNFGTVPSTEPTTMSVSIESPLEAAANVVAGTGSGPFRVEPGQLPATAAAGGALPLRVTFTPVSAGSSAGTIPLTFSVGAESVDVELRFRAVAEPVNWQFTPETLDFGVMSPGSVSTRTVEIRNGSSFSTATVEDGGPMDGAFTVDAGGLPRSLAPGEAVTLSVRFEPLGAGGYAEALSLQTNAPDAPVTIWASGSTAGAGETVYDFGLVELQDDTTPGLGFSVPADATSITLEGWIGRAGNGGGTKGLSILFPGVTNDIRVGLAEFTGPSGHVYENASGTGPLLWLDEPEVFSITIPSSDRSQLQPVPGGGAYAFRLKRMSGSGGRMHVRAVVERRNPASPAGGVLDLNVWLASGLGVTATTAPTDPRLQSILQRIFDLLAQQGIARGAVAYHDVADTRYDQVTEAEFPEMLRLTGSAPQVRVNLFFVDEALGGGVLGVAAAIGGPQRNGTSGSGVMSLYDGGYLAATVGLVAAHEIGHFLGLYHTVEQSGSHDPIDDTPNCPAQGTGGPCAVEGGGLLMHWQAVGGTNLTNGQGLVLRGHPLVAPSAGAAPLRLGPVRLEPQERSELLSLPPTWCATCRHCSGSSTGR